MRTQMFEIKVALLGHVSVGKTTVLNALFRDKLGEVSMRRTTAGIDYFRVSTPNKNSPTFDDATPRSAESILKEITVDNAVLRASNDIKEKFFDVELENEICEMRDDTRLVVIDIPGMNEARTSSKYKGYVASKWETFDCAVVVMDAKQGVNTQEQVDLLKFVKGMCKEKKQLPVIILCNKVDGLDEEELAFLVREVREEVERIFDAKSREQALEALLKGKRQGGGTFPVFIPISAIHAYIYQSASLMDLQQFKRFDKVLIERLGLEEIGKRRWKKLSEDEKYKAAFEVISDPQQYEEGLRASNFDKFLTVLNRCVGGESTQLSLLEKQLDFARSDISSDECITTQIRYIYERSKALGQPTDSLRDAFWDAYNKCKDHAFKEFNDHPGHVEKLANPMTQLTEYYKWVSSLSNFSAEKDPIVNNLRELVRRQLGVVFELVDEWSYSTSLRAPRDSIVQDLAAWNDLSAMEWSNIFESILLNAGDLIFCEWFGKEKIYLEQYRLYKLHESTSSPVSLCPSCRSCTTVTRNGDRACPLCRTVWSEYGRVMRTCSWCLHNGRNQTTRLSGYCGQCGYTTKDRPPRCPIASSLKVRFLDGKIQPDKEDDDAVPNIEVAESLSDPKHFGHLAWKFCRFASKLQQEERGVET